jgi:hypothetical protein
MIDNPQYHQLRKYVNRIKNPSKKLYATLYWLWVAAGSKPDSEPSHEGLCNMAAQGVRMNFAEILKQGAEK